MLRKAIDCPLRPSGSRGSLARVYRLEKTCILLLELRQILPPIAERITRQGASRIQVNSCPRYFTRTHAAAQDKF